MVLKPLLAKADSSINSAGAVRGAGAGTEAIATCCIGVGNNDDEVRDDDIDINVVVNVNGDVNVERGGRGIESGNVVGADGGDRTGTNSGTNTGTSTVTTTRTIPLGAVTESLLFAAGFQVVSSLDAVAMAGEEMPRMLWTAILGLADLPSLSSLVCVCCFAV